MLYSTTLFFVFSFGRIKRQKLNSTRSTQRCVKISVNLTRCHTDSFHQALAGLKQKLKKYNRDFEKAIEAYRENPVESDEEPADADVDDGTYVKASVQ